MFQMDEYLFVYNPTILYFWCVSTISTLESKNKEELRAIIAIGVELQSSPEYQAREESKKKTKININSNTTNH
jgi:hypothetical protein